MPHISLAAEKLAVIGPLVITNSLVASWLTTVLLIVLAILATRKLSLIPTHLQSIAELVVGGLYDFFSKITGKHARLFFPLLATLFLFIITANWLGLLPGFGTIGFTEGEKFVPLLRGATADINTTLSLAIIAVVAIQYFGFRTVGLHYSSRFFTFKNPISFFVGILEIISELSKVISFAFRLFGNIFAGEVLLTVMAFLLPFIVPLPFIAMELFVGFIQALVFSMLTSVFLNVAVAHGEEHSKI